MAVRHLKGFLSLSKKYEKDFMDKVYEDLLKKTIISFNTAMLCGKWNKSKGLDIKRNGSNMGQL